MREFNRKKAIAVFFFMLIGLLAVWLGYKVIWRYLNLSSGLYDVRSYGKVADETGRGIEGVNVKIKIYTQRGSGSLTQPEKSTIYELTTDQNGCFQLKGVFGYAIELNFERMGQGMDAIFPPHDPRRPVWGFVYTDRFSRAAIPDTPEKRAVYYLK